MEQMKINVPDGHEIDLEESDLSTGEIFFKVKSIKSYYDVVKELFLGKKGYFIDSSGKIITAHGGYGTECATEPNASITVSQLEAILALNELCNVAKYLNGDWKPDWTDGNNYKYRMSITDDEINIQANACGNVGAVYFKSRKLAEIATGILGENKIKKALTLNH